MIRVIYIIEPIVSGCIRCCSLFNFFISRSLPAKCDGEPRGSVVHFDVVLFWQINRTPLLRTRSQTASEPLGDHQRVALHCPCLFNLCSASCLTLIAFLWGVFSNSLCCSASLHFSLVLILWTTCCSWLGYTNSDCAQINQVDETASPQIFATIWMFNISSTWLSSYILSILFSFLLFV